jgi:hypothetical protein
MMLLTRAALEWLTIFLPGCLVVYLKLIILQKTFFLLKFFPGFAADARQAVEMLLSVYNWVNPRIE